MPELHLTGSFWDWMANFDINKAGFVIDGMFVLTWITALLVWKYGNIEEKQSAKLSHHTGADQFEKDLAARYDADIAAGRM